MKDPHSGGASSRLIHQPAQPFRRQRPEMEPVHGSVGADQDSRWVGAGNTERSLYGSDSRLVCIGIPANRITEASSVHEIAGILIDIGAHAHADDGRLLAI